MRPKFIAIILVLAIVTLGTYVVFFSPSAGHYQLGSTGTSDFTKFWSGYQLFTSGKSPYNPGAMFREQSELGWENNLPRLMSAPPWLLVIISPVLNLDFVLGAKVWLVLNLVFALLCGLLVCNTYTSKKDAVVPAVLLSLFFAPSFLVISLGQLGLLLACGACGFLWALETRRDVLAGALLTLISIKPHLFYLLYPTIIWWAAHEKRLLVIASFAMTTIILLGIVINLNPQSLVFWIDAVFSWQNGIETMHANGGTPATLWGWMLQYLPEGKAQLYSGVAVPSCCFIGLVAYLLKFEPKINWKKLLPPLLCVSLFTSMFAWNYDHAILVICQIALICIAFENGAPILKRWLLYTIILVLQLATAMFGASVAHARGDYFWFPIVTLALWYFGLRLLSSSKPQNLT